MSFGEADSSHFDNELSTDSTESADDLVEAPSTLEQTLRDYLQSNGILTPHTDSILNHKPKQWQRILSNVLFAVGLVMGAWNGKPSAIANQEGFNGFLDLENLPKDGLLYEITNWLSYYGSYFVNVGIGMLASGIALSQSVYLREYLLNKGWWNLLHLPVAALSGFSAVYNYILNQKTSTPIPQNIIDTAANGLIRLLSGNAVLLKLYRPYAADIFTYQLTHLGYLIENVPHERLKPIYDDLSDHIGYEIDTTTKRDLARSLAQLPIEQQALVAKFLFQRFGIAKPTNKEFFWKHKLPQYAGALIAFLGGVPLSEVIRQDMGPVWDGLASPATYLFFIDYGRDFIKKLLFLQSILKWYLNLPIGKKIYYGIAFPLLVISTMMSIFGSEGLEYDTHEFDPYYLLTLGSFTAICTNFLGGLFLINLFVIFAEAILKKFFNYDLGDPHAQVFTNLLNTIEGSNIRNSKQLLEIINNDFGELPECSETDSEDSSDTTDVAIAMPVDAVPPQTSWWDYLTSFWRSSPENSEATETDPLLAEQQNPPTRICTII